LNFTQFTTNSLLNFIGILWLLHWSHTDMVNRARQRVNLCTYYKNLYLHTIEYYILGLKNIPK